MLPGISEEEMKRCEYPDSPEFFKSFRVKTLKEFPGCGDGRGKVKAGTEAWAMITPDWNIHLIPTAEAIMGFHDGAVEHIDFERL